MKKVVFRLAELFCGPGGIAWGAKLAHIKCKDTAYSVLPVWANDIEWPVEYISGHKTDTD